MQTQSELILERGSWIIGRVDHSEGVPPQVKVEERHLPGLTDKCHESRRPDKSFINKRLLGDVRPHGRIPLF
jgi:hypothetical protein